MSISDELPAPDDAVRPDEGSSGDPEQPSGLTTMEGDDRQGVSGAEPQRGRHRKEREDRGSFLREVPALVLIALVVAILIKTFLVQAFFIPSASMEPTLVPGDRVLVNKLAYRFGDIHRGDVVVFSNPQVVSATDRNWFQGVIHWLGEGIGVAQPPDEDLIKRVIGLPGDTVQIRGHAVFVDGQRIAEPYLTAQAKASMQDFGPERVPPGQLFVMGDNRGNSADSRFTLGPVPERDVIGKAFVIIWPPSDVGGLG